MVVVPVTDIFVLIFGKKLLLLYAFSVEYVDSFTKNRFRFILDTNGHQFLLQSSTILTKSLTFIYHLCPH